MRLRIILSRLAWLVAPSVKRLSFFSWEEKGRLLSVVENIGICGFWAEREVYFRRKRDGEDLNLEDREN